jgi:hypothetical protein
MAFFEARFFTMQTVQEVAAHLSDVKSKENLAVRVEVSQRGNRITLRAERSDAMFNMDCASDGTFLIGYPPASEEGWPTQVTNGPRRSLKLAEAIAEAETWMRRFAGR